MILELQIPATALSMLVRNQIRARTFCDTELHTVGDSSFYVDHFVANDTMSVEEFGDTVLIQSGNSTTTLPGKKLHIRQGVTVSFATLEAIRAAGVNPPETFQLDATIVIDMTLAAANGGVTFEAAVSDVEASPEEFRLAVLNAVGGYQVSTPLDLSALSEVLEAQATITNAGIRCDGTGQNGTVVSLRFEINGSDDPVADYTSYYSGQFVDWRGGAQWALLLDQGFIVATAVAEVSGTLANAAFSLDSGPSGSWDAASVSVCVSFGGEAIDACWCLWDQIDVDIEATVTIALSAQPGTLVTSSLLETSPNPLEMSDSGEGDLTGSGEIVDTEHSDPPVDRVNGVRDALYVESSRRRVVIDVAPEGEGREVARYSTTPWFALGVHAGGFLALADEHGVTFFQCLASHEV